MAHYEAESLRKLLANVVQHKSATIAEGTTPTVSGTPEAAPVATKEVVTIPPPVPLLKDMPPKTSR